MDNIPVILGAQVGWGDFGARDPFAVTVVILVKYLETVKKYV
jgi:hypothetical protein